MKYIFIIVFLCGLLLTACDSSQVDAGMVIPEIETYCEYLLTEESDYVHYNNEQNVQNAINTDEPVEIIKTTDNGYVTEIPKTDAYTPPNNRELAATILHISPEIELYVYWFMTPLEGRSFVYTYDTFTEKNDFLRQFNSYTRLGEPSVHDWSWVVFGANTDLYDFFIFRMGLACAPWRDYDWNYNNTYPDFFYYMASSVRFSGEVLPFGEVVVLPWETSYIFAHTDVGFLDETGRRRYVTLRVNVGDYGQPLILGELNYFDNKANCPSCAS